MGVIELQIPPAALFEVFEATTVPPGMTHSVPGGTLQLGDMPLEKRTHDGGLVFIPILVRLGSVVAINLFSNWLYDKLKRTKVRRVRINRVEIEVTPEGIIQVITEAVEVESERSNEGIGIYQLESF